jgi:ACS family glucarate transporter-like MFS transporter
VTASGTSAAPRNGRRTLLQFTFALSLITFLDRVAISSAAPAIREELGLSPSQMGWVFSAFTLAYAIFEIPTGWLGDRFGPRKVLTRIVLWWSVWTAGTGMAWNLPSLLSARLLFGMGEAGAYPNISRSFSRWFPVSERGFAHGTVFAGSRVGGAIAPPLVVLVMSQFGWRAAFAVFGSVGLIWCAFWWRWYRDSPADHPAVSKAELSAIEAGMEPEGKAVTWRSLLSLNLLVLCVVYFCVIYGLYFYLTWLPTYFREARGYDAAQAAGLSSMVLLTGGIATVSGGWLTDQLVKKFGLKIGRSVGAISMPISGFALIAAAMTGSPFLAAIMFAIAAACTDLCMSACWAICHDIGGEAAGRVTGAMNTFGNLGGALSPLVVGYALEGGSSWERPLLIGGAVYIVGGLLTLVVNPRKRLVS